MTTAVASGQQRDNRSEQLKQLRRQMAAVSGKVGAGHRGATVAEDPAPAAVTAAAGALPVPGLLAGALPGGLARGTVAVASGARSLPLQMVAAVTAGGGNAAIIGQPDTGLLAAAQMGADLSRIAVIPDPGKDPVEVATVLMDGLDLVVLSLAGATVAPARARVVAARARHRGAVLLIVDGDWPEQALRIDARVRGYEVTGGGPGGRAAPGAGRIGAVHLDVRARGRQVLRARVG